MFEWDQVKAKANLLKHGVSFGDTFAVFEDPHALTLNQIVDKEQRHLTLGMDAFGRLLLVVYIWRADRVRIISARKATRAETRQYESEL